MEHEHEDITVHISGLRRYATVLTRNPVDADELVQETLCRAIERMRPWRRVHNKRTYLFAILHNLFIDKFVKKNESYELISDDVIERKLIVAPSQFYHMELRELDEALLQLPQHYRDVLLLVGLEGMSYRAAASVLGVPLGTIMSRLSRAREVLREKLDRPRDELAERDEPKERDGGYVDEDKTERRGDEAVGSLRASG